MEKKYEFVRGISGIVNIEQDEHCEDPREWMETEIKTFESQYGLDDYLRKLGIYDLASQLFCGEVVEHEGRFYAGLERYSHSGDSYAICRRGSYLDRWWDVSPFVGVIHGPEKDYLEGDLKQFNDWNSGNCWRFEVNLHNFDGTPLEGDSCWGFVGDRDYCEKGTTDSMYGMLIPYLTVEEMRSEIENETPLGKFLSNKVDGTPEQQAAILFTECRMPDIDLELLAARNGRDESDTFPKVDWIYQVMNRGTLLGYWEWVRHQEEEGG